MSGPAPLPVADATQVRGYLGRLVRAYPRGFGGALVLHVLFLCLL